MRASLSSPPQLRLPRLRLPKTRKRPTEGSVALRAWVLAAVLVGEAAVLTTGYFDAATAVLVPLLTAGAFVVSHRRRRERNLVIKVLLAVFALAALAAFFRDLLSSLYDTRVPLAQLFLWVQVIHSFDLPARKDLGYSLLSGLVLLAVGAVLSTGMLYGVFVLAFLACGLAALSHLQLSRARERAGVAPSVSAERGLTLGVIVPGTLAVLAVGFVCFSLLPQRQEMSLAALPTSFFQEVAEDFSGEISNPDYQQPPPGGDPFAGPPQSISRDSYHGFNPYMDLRSRGRLSEEIVMKVRSEETIPYRGTVFDEYNGKGWESSVEEGDLKTLRSDGPRFDILAAGGTEQIQGPSRSVAQVFQVEEDASSVIFGAYRPQTVFFPASGIKIDPYASLRAPYEIPAGSTYSVISEVPDATGDKLRSAGTDYPEEVSERYTSLPSGGLDRTRALAREITADTDDPYDAVTELNDYLRQSYDYDLSIPPQSREMDAVEYFLFEEQRGYCEQFASALTVMARSLGIPARVTTGYNPGEYNPFTGLYEVRASDAHAWVEVYFPGVGWSTFNPTPGFDSTPWSYERTQSVQGGAVLGFLAQKTGQALSPAAAPASALVRGVAGLNPGSIVAAGVLLGAVLAPAIYLRKLLARRRSGHAKDRPIRVADARIYERYRELTAALERAGVPREPVETPEEYSRRAACELGEPRVARLGEIYLYARFRDTVPAALAEEFDGLESGVLARLANAGEERESWRERVLPGPRA